MTSITSRWPAASTVWHTLRVGRTYAAPPDGGTAAASIIAVAFALHVFTVGFIYVTGLFATAWLQEPAFERPSKAGVAWALSLCYGAYQAMGVVAGGIVSRWGTRTCTVVGAICLAAGFGTSSYVTSLPMLYVTFGPLVGAGCCLGFIPVVFQIQRYFKRHRATATGIAVAGTGIGAFILGPLTQSLMANFGWRGAARDLALICGCVIPALAIPLVPVVIKPSAAVGPDIASPEAVAKKVLPDTAPLSENPGEVQWDTAAVLNVKVEGDAPSAAPSHERSQTTTDIDAHDALDTANPLEQAGQDSLPTLAGVTTLQPPTASACAASTPDDESAPPKSLREMLRMRKFRMWLVVSAIYGGSWFIVLANLNTYAVEEEGMDPALAATLVSFQGGANVAGRLILGFFADRAKVSKVVLLAWCVGMMGVCTLGLIWFGGSFAFLAFYSIVYGFAGGSVVSIQAPVTVSIVGLASVALGQGMVQSISAPMVVVTPLLTGWMRDVTGSYTSVWILGAASMLLSAFLYVKEIR